MISEVLNSTPLAGTVLMQCHCGKEWSAGRAGVSVGLHYWHSVCPAGNCQQYQHEPGQAWSCDHPAALWHIPGQMGALCFHVEGWPSAGDDNDVKWAYTWSAPCLVSVKFLIQCSGAQDWVYRSDSPQPVRRGARGSSDQSAVGQTHMKSARN